MTIEELRVLITAKTDGLTDGVNKVKNKINELRGTTDNMTSSNQRNVDKMKTQYDQLLKKLDNVNARAEIQQKRLSGLQEKYARMSSLGQDSPKMERLREQILNAENRMQSLINISDNTSNKIWELDDKIANLGINTEKSNDKFKKMQERLNQIKDRFKRTGDEAKRSTGKIAGFANLLDRSLRRVLRRILLYNVMYRMVRGFIGYLNGALQTNNRFVQSLNVIKTNLRVAFQPIYDFVLPAINALMKGLATLTGYIASFTSALFGKTYKQSYDAAKGIETAKKAMDGYGASAKKAKGQLASFDEINVLQTKEDSGGGGADGGFEMEMPEMPEFELGWLDRLKEKLEPTIEAIQRLVQALNPLKEFVAQGAIDFYNNFLVPVGNWVFGEGLPRFIDAITNGLGQVDWGRINESLNRLWEALAPFAINVGEGLLWLWENVLVPLGTWVGNEIVPRFLELLANVLDILNVTIEALKPLGLWLWDEFLQPLAEWTGEQILKALDWLNEKLEKFSKWIEDNEKTVENIAIVVGSFAAAWGLVNIAIGVWNVVGAIATGVTTAFGIAVGILTSPITLVILAITALIAIGVLLYKNWDEIGPFLKKTWEGIKAKATEIWGAIKKFFVDTWDSIKKKTEEIWNNIKTFLSDKIWNPIKNTATNIWNGIKEFIIGKWDDIKTGISNKKDALIEAVKKPFNIAKDWIDELISDAKNWGKNLIGNIIDGINSMITKVKETVKKVADAIGDFLGFSSPTKAGPGRYADKWMPNMMDMLADGIKDNKFKIEGAVNMTANSLSGVQRPDNTSSIVSAISGALGGRDGDLHLTIKLGEDTITEKVVSNINRQSRISGKTVIQV